MAQAIFKSWFVDFEPFGGVMPRDWREGTLGDIAEVTSGKRPLLKKMEKKEGFSNPIIGASSIIGFTDSVLHDERILVTGRVGTHGIIQRFNIPCWASDNCLVIKSTFYEFVYQVLKTIDFKNMNRGSTQPLITQTDLKNINVTLPIEGALNDFESVVGVLMLKLESNNLENQRLSQLRDTLLPRLMNGEIDVENVVVR